VGPKGVISIRLRKKCPKLLFARGVGDGFCSSRRQAPEQQQLWRVDIWADYERRIDKGSLILLRNCSDLNKLSLRVRIKEGSCSIHRPTRIHHRHSLWLFPSVRVRRMNLENGKRMRETTD